LDQRWLMTPSATNLFCPIDSRYKLGRIDLRERHQVDGVGAAVPIAVKQKLVRAEVHHQERLWLEKLVTGDEERRKSMRALRLSEW
jgi:hypothetical protein